jgi:hypothetical protein
MTIEKRFATVERLQKNGIIEVAGVYALDVGGLVRIHSTNKEKLKTALTRTDGQYNGMVLDNPMTWDTFTHLFLLNK